MRYCKKHCNSSVLFWLLRRKWMLKINITESSIMSPEICMSNLWATELYSLAVLVWVQIRDPGLDQIPTKKKLFVCNILYVCIYLVIRIVHPKMKMQSLITHPHVVPNPEDLLSSSEHKLRYFLWNPRAFWPCIDSKGTTTFTTQKGNKDIVKVVHVKSVVQP